jgi:hypothetical protein
MSVLTTAVDVLKNNMGTITVERLDPNSAARYNFCPGSVSTGPHGCTESTKVQHHPKRFGIPPLMLMSARIQ